MLKGWDSKYGNSGIVINTYYPAIYLKLSLVKLIFIKSSVSFSYLKDFI